MSKHTQGPLNIHRSYGFDNKPLVIEAGEFPDGGGPHDSWIVWDFRIAKGDKIVASITCSTANRGGWAQVSDPEEARANARLFIAAPELLEALKGIASKQMCVCKLIPMLGQDPPCETCVLKALVTKAEGGAA